MSLSVPPFSLVAGQVALFSEPWFPHLRNFNEEAVRAWSAGCSGCAALSLDFARGLFSLLIE